MSEKTLHASAVVIDGRGVLITGASGSGKSSLALQLIGLGATLIADDRCILRDAGLFAEIRRPPNLPDLIEARRVGLISVPSAASAPLSLVVDLDKQETERLPQKKFQIIFGHNVAVLHNCLANHFAAAISVYVKQNEI